ncbi:MarR family winged helix-turn-helix transcriptional regulator [Siminovitchia fordii]|uniref:HTH-type transcriptional regulator YwoH n=1 Tax=Siminovitchia fordii TaxID=254759 RepID=A0ABQ4K6W6_9BACI|nr:MarR family transcriptional regulator [Siminovitchia fordii]GIN20593.1 putative HTH-type transcriptional regulator YwoH [Siminovitchia fordii]
MNPVIHEIFQRTRLLSKQLNNVLKDHDLFTSQWTVLYCVHQHGEMTLTDIWKYLNVEAPTITRTVKRLEELGWLKTDLGKDRREKMVRLSEYAETRLPLIKVSIERFEQRSMENLTEEEQTLLMELLKKLDVEG